MTNFQQPVVLSENFSTSNEKFRNVHKAILAKTRYFYPKKQMQNIQAIFFDMDGVLIFSEPYWQEAERKIFREQFGIELTDEDVHKSTGLKTTEVVSMHSRNYGLNCDIESIGFEIEKEVIATVYKQGKPMEGLKELTDWIREQGWRRCLVTSSSRYVLDNILAFVGLTDFFERKFTAYDELWGKPNPAVYLSAIDHIQIPKKNIIVIEDSSNGVKAAHAAGLKVIGLPEEYNFKNELYDSMILKSFHSHFEILEFLKSNQSS